MNLTQEQKRVKLAEACGWKRIPKDDVGAAARLFYGDTWWRDAENNTIASVEQLPDYFNDLNACHEAEKTMTYEQHCHYADLLNFLIIPGPAANKSTFATAAQRAEALGQTLNLW